MPEFEGQDDIDKEAYKQWKLRWNKENYTTSKEEKLRFERFQQNLRLEEANSGNSGPSEPPWMALDIYADLPPYELYRVEILGQDPDKPEERIEYTDSDSEERGLFMEGYGKVHYSTRDEDGTAREKFFYTKNFAHPFEDKDSWYLPPVKGQNDHEKDDTKEEEHVTAKRQSDHEKVDTKEFKRQAVEEEDAAVAVEPEPENEVVLLL